MRRPRLLLAGLYRPGGGLTNVLEGLATALRAHFDLDLLGFATGRTDGTRTLAGQPIQVIAGNGRDYGADAFWLGHHLEATRPNMILVSGPGFMATSFLRQLEHYRHRAAVALYMPLEGTLAGKLHLRVMERLDACLLYTHDALGGVASLCRQESAGNPDFRAPLLSAVGHGIATQHFFATAPRGDARQEATRRSEARARLFPGRGDLDKAFIVLNANRVCARKRLDLSLQAFALFARGKPDAWLILHTGLRFRAQEAELRRQIAGLGLAGRVLLSPQSEGEMLSTARLNLLYNACDVGLSTSAGEGWGLGTFEHAATRAAQIVPDHSSFAENWFGSALLVPTESSEFLYSEGCDIHAVSPPAVSASLERVYRDPVLRLELALLGEKHALSPAHRWTAVAARMVEALTPLTRRQSPEPRELSRKEAAACTAVRRAATA